MPSQRVIMEELVSHARGSRDSFPVASNFQHLPYIHTNIPFARLDWIAQFAQFARYVMPLRMQGTIGEEGIPGGETGQLLLRTLFYAARMFQWERKGTEVGGVLLPWCNAAMLGPGKYPWKIIHTRVIFPLHSTVKHSFVS